MSKLDELKNEADMMGIDYPEDINFQKLKKMIKDAGEDRKKTVEAEPKLQDIDVSILKPGVDTSGMKIHPTEKDYKHYKIDKEKSDLKKMKTLIRVRIVNMNPYTQYKKTESVQIWNAKWGKVASRVIPLNTVWHVEKAILDMLQSKTYPHKEQVQTIVDPATGVKQTEVVITQRPEYAIQVLPPLTKEELEKLADDQRKTDRLKD